MTDHGRYALMCGVLAVVSGAIWWSCFSCGGDISGITLDELLSDVKNPESLVELTKTEMSRKEILKITDGVYMSYGYALGNSILIEAPEGLIIVDTTENVEAARLIREEFRRISSKPLKAIIYTHCHPDHTMGSEVFLEGEEPNIPIWAHEKFTDAFYDMIYIGQGLMKRSQRQFGVFLPEKVGIGARLRYTTQQKGWVLPDHFVKGSTGSVTIAGLKLEFYHIPGETDDHLAVWIPDRRILLPGDNIYRAFPNLYAIRGSTARNVLTWTRSLRLLRELHAEYLVPGHGRPVTGKDTILKLITTYGDAVQFIHDQTVRYINKGLHPDEIVQLVQLPPALEGHQYLQEFYGTVEWSVKGVYDYYLGWFNGRIDDLLPLQPKDSSRRWLQLAGGVERAVHEARKAFDTGEERWALEMTSAVLDVDPANQEAKKIRAQTIKSIAARWTTSNGRNYILTTMLEDFGFLKLDTVQRNLSHIINSAPLDLLIRLMATKLRAENVKDVTSSAVFHFTDVNSIYTLTVRNCIMDVAHEEMPGWDVKLSMTSQVWRSLLARESSSMAAYFSGAIVIDGGIMNARRFLEFFDRDGE